jgi:predicted nucleic acid-binding protein
MSKRLRLSTAVGADRPCVAATAARVGDSNAQRDLRTRSAELSAGPHQVRRSNEHSDYDEHAERARRMDVLQRAENEFDSIPFDVEAARMYGRICAAVVSAGREPRHRVADLMIAAVAAAEELPLFTTNPDNFKGLDDLITSCP